MGKFPWTAENLAETQAVVLDARASGLWARFRNELINTENRYGVPKADGQFLEEAAQDFASAKVAAECARIRRELLEWLVGDHPEDAGIIHHRRVVTEIDRICPAGEKEGE